MSSFTPTGLSYLVRRNCGGYYWQAFIAGASRRGSLRTKSLSVAKTRLPAALEQARKRWGKQGAGSREMVTGRDWLKDWSRRQGERTRIKKVTREHDQKLARLLMEEEWAGVDLRRLKVERLRDWWRGFCDRCEADTVNARLRVLKAALKRAVEAGFIPENPADELERKRKVKRVMVLPTVEEVRAVIESIRDQGRRWSSEAAAMVELAAFSGMRPKELVEVKGEDFGESVLVVRGGEYGTKNHREREVPIVADLEAVIVREGWRERRGKLFSLGFPREALKGACDRSGVARFRPYDLRHFFITRCIESGVDVPTVALWAGHQDGGALIMSTYTHVTRPHSLREARRVKF